MISLILHGILAQHTGPVTVTLSAVTNRISEIAGTAAGEIVARIARKGDTVLRFVNGHSYVSTTGFYRISRTVV